MSHKGCKDRRAYVNKSIYAAAAKIYGKDDMANAIDQIIKDLDPTKDRITALSDEKAAAALNILVEDARKVAGNLDVARVLLGDEPRMSKAQKSKIIAICMYSCIKMTPGKTFDWITARIPEVKLRMAHDDVSSKWLKALWDEMSVSEARYIIQMLERFEKNIIKKQKEG